MPVISIRVTRMPASTCNRRRSTVCCGVSRTARSQALLGVLVVGWIRSGTRRWPAPLQLSLTRCRRKRHQRTRRPRRSEAVGAGGGTEAALGRGGVTREVFFRLGCLHRRDTREAPFVAEWTPLLSAPTPQDRARKTRILRRQRQPRAPGARARAPAFPDGGEPLTQARLGGGRGGNEGDGGRARACRAPAVRGGRALHAARRAHEQAEREHERALAALADARME